MRIIGGILKGTRINTPHDLPIRPTTDVAKEALFNILIHQIDFVNLQVLDLFSGSGNISLEFASRGSFVDSVDSNTKCCNFIQQSVQKLKLLNVNITRGDAFKFLTNTNKKYDLIFADPPYDLSGISQIQQIVLKRNLLNTNGVLVIEHQSLKNFNNLLGFSETRHYGNVGFSFFNFNSIQKTE